MNSANTLKADAYTYYPASGYSTLAFEDLWPAKGDYDFNDLVVEYQFRTATNASNFITEIVGTFIVRAAGAGTANGFGFELHGLDTTGFIASGSSLMSGWNAYVNTTDGWEDGQTYPVVIVTDDVSRDMDYANTQGWHSKHEPPVVFTVKITPRVGVEVEPSNFLVDYLSFNPFLIIDWQNEGRNKEVHKIDFPPTDLADPSYFGQDDDYSVTGSSASLFGASYYQTSNRFPWVLEIPSAVMTPTLFNSVFDYPTEKSDINWAYLHFAEWAESGGVTYGSTDPDPLHEPWWIKKTGGYRNILNIYDP
jgi:LruC domain-containing protein